jgi:hypothetical protein
MLAEREKEGQAEAEIGSGPPPGLSSASPTKIGELAAKRVPRATR